MPFHYGKNFPEFIRVGSVEIMIRVHPSKAHLLERFSKGNEHLKQSGRIERIFARYRWDERGKCTEKKTVFFFARSLTGGVIVYQVAAVVFSTIILVSVDYLILSNRVDQEYTLRSKEHIAFLQQSLTIPLWTYDEEGIKTICNFFIQNDFVASIEVTNNYNEALFSYHNEEEITSIRQEATITHEGETIGEVRIGLTTRPSQ